jgi:CelD/BcsL family acetyltransferase involved in cellulose biosynthesis
MREGAAAGWLRLGLLEQANQVLAAQLWVVQGAWASVLKLAHDERHRALSPGTVLTGFMIRHLMQHDGATVLDFGRGDDAYKQAWTTTRAQRHGLILANPRRAAGLAAILRHHGGHLLRSVRKTAVLDRNTAAC